MIIALQTPNGKIGKYVLTKKNTGDILTPQEIEQRFNTAAKKIGNTFEAWKEALNGTVYELWYS